ncbi:MAG: hypothetical protein J4452_02045 [Candidatus Aenigmarchaeota archaeon]|nr:hypothetical protein [Candidatus Aenigmarchaeota archaeon]
MPIFARTKLLIEDECLAPPGVVYITLNYNGPNPDKLYVKIKELIYTIWKVELNELQEKDFSWDRSGGAEKFSVRFEVTKDLDQFSYMYIIIVLSGEARPSKEFGKEGSATVRMEGKMRTEYPQDTIWQRSFFYEMFRVFYHRVIYEDARKRFRETCRENILTFQDEVKSFLNILPKVA